MKKACEVQITNPKLVTILSGLQNFKPIKALQFNIIININASWGQKMNTQISERKHILLQLCKQAYILLQCYFTIFIANVCVADNCL